MLREHNKSSTGNGTIFLSECLGKVLHVSPGGSWVRLLSHPAFPILMICIMSSLFILHPVYAQQQSNCVNVHFIGQLCYLSYQPIDANHESVTGTFTSYLPFSVRLVQIAVSKGVVHGVVIPVGAGEFNPGETAQVTVTISTNVPLQQVTGMDYHGALVVVTYYQQTFWWWSGPYSAPWVL